MCEIIKDSFAQCNNLVKQSGLWTIVVNVWSTKTGVHCPRRAIGEMGFVDNVDY